MQDTLQSDIKKAAEVLKSYGAREVFLFGSASEGRLKANSDIDMAVSGLPPAVFFRAMSQAHDQLNRDLDLIDLDDGTPFSRFLREEGKLSRVA